MSAPAAPAPSGPMFTIRGTTYPVVLPKLRDPRLHLAATITSLQVLGQVAFDFELSIAQILIALGTCAVLEVAIALRKQHVIMWPASALLTGNGVAFVLRVPGTAHGDWWSLRGWWIFVGDGGRLAALEVRDQAGAASTSSTRRTSGSSLCFLLLGRDRADAARLLVGADVVVARARARDHRHGRVRDPAPAEAPARRARLLGGVRGGIGVLALAGHTMTARWHLGPITGFHFWWVLITSPEVLVFLFFMITDPKTAPRSPGGRLVYAVSLGLLAPLLIAPTTTEFAAKVALLGVARDRLPRDAVARLVPMPLDRRLVARPRRCGACAVSPRRSSSATRPPVASASDALPPGALPPITILPSQGVQTKLDRHTAELIAHDLLAAKPAGARGRPSRLPRAGRRQDPPTASRSSRARTYRLHQTADGALGAPSARSRRRSSTAPASKALAGTRLTNVAPSVGLDFRRARSASGCRTRTGDDGRRGLLARLQRRRLAGPVRRQLVLERRHRAVGGARRVAASQLFENVRGRFRDVTEQDACGPRRAGRRLRGRRPERRRAHGSRRHDDDRRRSALERRERDVHRARGAAVRRLVHGRRGRRRERRRPARRVRRRLLRPERAGAELARRVPDEHRGRARPALPERGAAEQRALPRGRRRRPGSRRPSSATASARSSSTSTATAGPTCTSRTTRIRTSST